MQDASTISSREVAVRISTEELPQLITNTIYKSALDSETLVSCSCPIAQKLQKTLKDGVFASVGRIHTHLYSNQEHRTPQFTIIQSDLVADWIKMVDDFMWGEGEGAWPMKEKYPHNGDLELAIYNQVVEKLLVDVIPPLDTVFQLPQHLVKSA